MTRNHVGSAPAGSNPYYSNNRHFRGKIINVIIIFFFFKKNTDYRLLPLALSFSNFSQKKKKKREFPPSLSLSLSLNPVLLGFCYLRFRRKFPMTNNRFSDFVDPLDSYSGLALFPKTFEVSLPAASSNAHHFDTQLQAIHNHLKSMALTSPDKLREQAKKILDGSSKSLNSKIMSDQASIDKNEGLPAVPEVNPRERRPALNRKRARFSLKPNSSQPAVSSEATLDIKKLKDPEEFFMAYERHENAKREIQKQMGGVLLDLEQQNPSLIERPRRPGMLGNNERRSIKYKHLYSSEDYETRNNVSSTQERNDLSILSPIYHSSQEETEHGFTTQEEELAGSISKEDHKVDEILDQLLSYNCEDLEGDGALNLLHEHLHIKPVELEKLQLPDFQEIPKLDLKSSRSGKLPRRSNVLSDIDNLLKGLSSKTPTKRKLGAESPISYVASPTPPKNPFALLPLLNQKILRSSLSNDPFSAHDIDQPVRNSSCIESINKEFDLADEGRQSEETVFEKDDNMERAKTDTSKQDGVLDVGSSASHVPVDDNTINSNMDNWVMNDEAREHDTDGDALANGTNIEDKVEETPQETLIAAQSGLDIANLALDNLNAMQSHLDKPSTASIQDQVRNRSSGIPDDGSEHHTEMEEEHRKMPLDKKHKAKTHSQKPRKRRENSGRKSLGGAGTKWESGVRRSTRIRCRPLEYWRGERLLYGRIHKSLPTVIGLKYASPGKGNGALTVKSYVSAEHQELVELAGLH